MKGQGGLSKDMCTHGRQWPTSTCSTRRHPHVQDLTLPRTGVIGHSSVKTP